MAPRTKTEYRIVAEDAITGPDETFGAVDLEDARGDAEALRSQFGTVRIQRRTVTETPWEDVADV